MKKIFQLTDDPADVRARLSEYREITRLKRKDREKNPKERPTDPLELRRFELLEGIVSRQDRFLAAVGIEMAEAATVFGAGYNGVSAFGSARPKAGESAYDLGVEVVSILAEAMVRRNLKRELKGLLDAIVTGWGPGQMEAGNYAARSKGCPSLGLGINLPFEQTNNPYADALRSYQFQYFFTRKYWFHRASKGGFLLLPSGGYGTLDELFEMLQHNQRNPHDKRPVVCYDPLGFWNKALPPLLNFLVNNEFVSRADADMVQFTDDKEQVVSLFFPS